jgi:hypothetical protein
MQVKTKVFIPKGGEVFFRLQNKHTKSKFQRFYFRKDEFFVRKREKAFALARVPD